MGTNDIPVLQGGYAPIDRETVADDLRVEGEIPRDLNGMHVRNGPNRRFEPAGRYHWFDGDGMLHLVEFDRGRVRYRNRWVMTDALREELAAGRALWKGVKEPPRKDRPDMPLKNTSNTDVKFHAGKLVSMWYLGGDVYQVDPRTLDTVGKLDCGGALDLPISAHSKVDERTGEFIWFAYGKDHPYMHYGVIGADGALKHRIPVELPGPRLPHDMAVTTNYTVLHDLPLFYDMEAFKAGRHKLKFYAELPARFGVVPRYGRADQIRWFEAEPCYMYHVVNAWEEGSEIVMVGTPFRLPRDREGRIAAEQFPRMPASLEHDFVLYEWRFDLATGRTRERLLDDIVNSEFPSINSALMGTKTRYSWNVLMGRNRVPEQPRFCGMTRFDLQTGVIQSYTEGQDFWYSEAPFAPKDGWHAEDDGYLVGFVWNGRDERSEVQVWDAKDIAHGPVAKIILPARVPHGFHSTWVSAHRLSTGR
jgi:carotenoid cleavage dioxygenase-like enzyme